MRFSPLWAHTSCAQISCVYSVILWYFKREREQERAGERENGWKKLVYCQRIASKQRQCHIQPRAWQWFYSLKSCIYRRKITQDIKHGNSPFWQRLQGFKQYVKLFFKSLDCYPFTKSSGFFSFFFFFIYHCAPFSIWAVELKQIITRHIVFG